MKDVYKVRQKIVDHLFSKVTYNEIDVPSLGATKTSLIDIAKAINEDYEDVYMAHHGIPDEQIKCIAEGSDHNVMLIKDGITASLDKYWLREGHKEYNDRIYDKSKWLVPIIALLITVSSLLYSNYVSRQTAKTEQKIESIEKELIELKARIK